VLVSPTGFEPVLLP